MLIGNGGNDTLIATEGENLWIEGGMGNDTFVIGEEPVRNVITDFSNVSGNMDSIKIRSSVATEFDDLTITRIDDTMIIMGYARTVALVVTGALNLSNVFATDGLFEGMTEEQAKTALEPHITFSSVSP